MRLYAIVSAITVAGVHVTSGARAQYTPTSGAGTCVTDSHSTVPCLKAIQGATYFGAADAVQGSSPNGVAVHGISGGDIAVLGESTSSAGVDGWSTSGEGVYGSSSTNNGVAGDSYTSSASGVYGNNSAGGYGVAGDSTTGTGVLGRASSSSSGYGVYGQSNAPLYAGVYGIDNASSSGNGVKGVTGAGYGVSGYATGAGSGVFGSNWGGWAGNFYGNLLCQGTPYAPQSTFTIWSDARLKKNIKPLEGSLDRLMQLRGVTYEWKDPSAHGNREGIQRGFIAQDVEKVLPEWVGVGPDGFKTLTMSGLEAMTVESIRTLKTENDDLRERVRALEAGRRPFVSGASESGLGLGLAAVAGAIVLTRRKRSSSEPER